MLKHKLLNIIFWTIDKIRGGELKKHLQEIDFMINNYEADEVKEKRNRQVEKLLSHFSSTSKYYSAFDGKKNLTDFPVINKNIIRNHFDDFLSNKFDKKELHKVSTSGSTGIPFVAFHDKIKRLRHTADTIYFNNLGGYDVGDKFYYIRIWNEINKQGALKKFYKNTVEIDTSNISLQNVNLLLDILQKDKNPKVLVGYGSSFEAISGYLQEIMERRGNYGIKSIISTAEAINPDVKNFLSKFFSCPVFSRYSNSENGFFGHQFKEGTDDYLANTASYVIELLKIDSDEPAENGEQGRIVITDLYNFATPFIRYDTGDIGTMGHVILNDQHIPVFKNIHGRLLDFIFDTSGNMLSPHLVDYTIRNTHGIKQFQFIQEAESKYCLILNSQKKETDEEDMVINSLKKVFGNNALINIKYVDDIPPISSGKRKIVINRMSKA